MSDTFPLLLKEGKLYYAVSHSSPKLRLTAMPQGGRKSLNERIFSPLPGEMSRSDRGGLWYKRIPIKQTTEPARISLHQIIHGPRS
jgi:hypothetical protein